MTSKEYIDNVLECPNCGSSDKYSYGKDWKCKKCGKFWRKKVRRNYVPWNKGLTKDISDIIAKASEKMRETKLQMIRDCTLDPSKNLPPKKYNISREKLYDLYWNKDMGQREISELLNISQGRISQLMKKYNIPNRGHGDGSRKHIISQEEINKKISKALKGNTNWKFGGSFPNKEEIKVINLLGEYHLPFKYVGDGSYLIKGKNPDFIYEKGKKIIEFFGERWHPVEHEEQRKQFFSDNGWDCFVIWGRNISSKKKRETTIKNLLKWFFNQSGS